MKQKRKVKSLIPQKENFNGGFLTALLFVLGVALCLGAASLMSTSSVGAAKLGRDISTLSYSGVDDVVEVLYNLDFAKPEDLEKKVAKMYINNNKDFYLQTSIPLVVNAEDTIGDSLKENQVIAGEKSNILGGYGNRVRGSNVTIIGGNENVMESIDGGSFDNSVILGGENIKLRDGNGFPAIIVGGKNHQVEPGHNGIVIVGGETQQINDKGAKNVVLIGGTEIDVNGENAENIVVGGKNIDVNEGINNVFVFSSDGSFVPQSSGAFYLNVAKGLGINTQALGKGITTNGPVKIGEVDINTVCSTSNLGVIGAWKVDSKISCLVGCSKTSAGEVGGPWEMLDRGKDCEIACDNNPSRCSQKHVDIPEVASYTGFCVKPGGMSLDNSSPCTPDEWGNYENAFFEAGLIDSTVDCPFGAANKCVYKCNTGYHLTGDRTNQFNAYTNKNQKCFKDCNLVEQLGSEWIDGDGKPIILKHNQMVTGYNTDIAVCARTNPYDGTDRGTKGDAFPEHCGNNQHKKPLVCVNGEMRLANNYTSPGATSTNAKSAGYWHRYCQTAPFSCDTSAGNFDLSRSDVTTTLIDSVSSWQSTDRSTSQGTRGKYKLCLDYKTGANYTTAPGNEAAGCVIVQQSQPYEVHYKFEGCQAGYRQSNRNSSPIDRSGDDYRVCRKQCKVTTQDGITRTINDNTTITLYKTNSEDCSKGNTQEAGGLCDAHTFVCDDGNWKSDGYNINNYKFISCTENGRLCSDYKVSASTMSSAEHSYYSSACYKWVPYKPEAWRESKTYTNGNPEVIACEYQNDWYQLIGCDPCYHTEDNQKCTYDYKDGSSCSSKSNAKTIGSIYYSWGGSSWNSSSSMGEHDSCSYVCNPGYYDNGNGCTESTGPSDEYGCSNKPKDGSGYDVETRTTTHDNAVWTYYVKVGNTGDNNNKVIYTGSECFSSCDVGYTKYKSMCIKGKFWQIECAGKVPYHATASDDWTTVSDNGYYHYGDGDCGFYCDEGYYWDTKYNACAKNECDANPCKIVVNYDFDGGDGSPSQEIVSCKGSITLPKTNRSCYTFNGWIGAGYVGKVGTIPFNETATRTINFTADWTRNTSECPYTCKGTEPSGIYVNKNSDVNGDSVDWKPLENYSTDLSRCQWRCISNEYYMDKDNVTCRKKKCAPDPTGQNIKLGDKEFLSATISDGKAWSYTSSSNPGACQWTCQDGYTRAKDAAGNWLNYCEAKKCGGTPGTGPKVITGVGEYTGTVTKNWHSVTGTTAPGVCEWTCQGGWVPSGNTCILDENAQCKNSENPTANGQTTGCISGTVVDLNTTTYTNKNTWSCKSKTNDTKTEGCRHCKSGYTGANCDKIENGKCNNSEKYKCFTGEVMGTSEDKTNHKYTWECDGVNGGTKATGCFKCFDQYVYNTATKKCEPNSNGDCGNPQVPYNCASGTSGAALFQNHKYTWDCIGALSTAHCKACEEGYDEDADGNCKNKKIDGECDFETAGCLAGEYEENPGTGGPYGKVWTCKGVGNGKNTYCVMQWECNGECKSNATDGFCGDMYHRYPEYGRDECAAAGAYVTYKEHGGIATRWPCWVYSPTSTDGWIEGGLYSTNSYCPSMVASAPYGGRWESCFKYKAALECSIFIDGNKTTYKGTEAVSKCSPISAKKPTNCTDSNPDGGGQEYVQTYTLTINANGGTYAGQTSYDYQAGVSLSVLTTQPTKDGYKFKEWNDKLNGNGTTYTSSSKMPASNLTVYAIWEPEEDCSDYPLTSCPAGGGCSTCPSDSSKRRLEVCNPSFASFGAEKDERGVTYRIQTDGSCPVGGVCAVKDITIYHKSPNGMTCDFTEHWAKVTSCQTCYRKAYMGPECVYDASAC